MDSTLLSKILKEALSSNDRVALPGFGEFYVEDVPASFSDKGFTINPPYRRICFRTDDAVVTDGIVERRYAEANNVDEEVAGRAVNECITSVKRELFISKTVDLPGLGRLRAMRGGSALFIEDEDLSVFMAYDELEPVSLRNLEASRSGRYTGDGVPGAAVPVCEPVPDTDGSEPVGDNFSADEAKGRKRLPRTRRCRVVAVAFLSLVILVEIALLSLAVLGQFKPDFVDKFLYTQEQLDIIHTDLGEI